MSDHPSRGGSRVVLTGLAVGAVLGAPIGATAANAAEPSAAVVESVAAPPTCGPGGESATAASIREQFQKSFAPGAVKAPVAELTTVICERG
jgi:hypothetical protein